jgi:hypothetical protein
LIVNQKYPRRCRFEGNFGLHDTGQVVGGGKTEVGTLSVGDEQGAVLAAVKVKTQWEQVGAREIPIQTKLSASE